MTAAIGPVSGVAGERVVAPIAVGCDHRPASFVHGPAYVLAGNGMVNVTPRNVLDDASGLAGFFDNFNMPRVGYWRGISAH